MAAAAHASNGPFSIAARSSNKSATLDTIEAALTALKAALHGEGLTKSSAEIFCARTSGCRFSQASNIPEGGVRPRRGSRVR